MPNQRTLRIHLVLEITIPQNSLLFQALVLAFWRFQELAATTLFSTVLQAIQDRARAELVASRSEHQVASRSKHREAAFPGRFRYKGTRLRKRRLPFGEVAFPLCKLWDRQGRRTVWPLAEVTALPGRIPGARRPSCPATAWR